jgi:hypothetical protein
MPEAIDARSRASFVANSHPNPPLQRQTKLGLDATQPLSCSVAALLQVTRGGESNSSLSLHDVSSPAIQWPLGALTEKGILVRRLACQLTQCDD